ncbi:hypothetical protein GEMRC1_011778 [Eukaryota sp. GEM-RC1]
MSRLPSLKKNRSFLLSSNESCQDYPPSRVCSPSPPLILSSLSDSLSCIDDPPPSSSFIFFPQSLWVLIDSHWIRCLLNSSLDNLDNPRRLRFFRKNLLTFFVKACSLGSRFFTSAVLGSKHFFETTTFPIVSRDFFLLSSLASFFRAEIRSVHLICDGYFDANHVQQIRHLITRLGLDLNMTSVNVINPLSPYFFTKSSKTPFQHIKELDVCLQESLSSSNLEDVFLKNSTLKKVSLSNRHSSFIPTSSFFNSLSKSTGIQVLDLSNIVHIEFIVLLPLLSSSTLKSLVFPSFLPLDSTVLEALKDNSCIQEVTFLNVFNYDLLGSILDNNTSLKKLEISIPNSRHPFNDSLSPIFKSLESNTSLLELIVHNPNQNNLDAQSIELMLRHNTGLIVLNLDLNFNSQVFRNLLVGVQFNSRLKKVCVRCRNFDLVTLMKLYEVLKTTESKRLNWSLDISKTSLNIENSLSNRNDFHLIDIDGCVFCFSPINSPQITANEVSSIKSFLECFSIKELTLNRCSFTSEAISSMCDLIRVNNTLTSIDFSYCRQSVNQDFSNLITTLQFNTSLRKINLSNTIVTLKSLLTIFELILGGKLPSIIIIDPHSVNFDDGYIHYNHEVHSSDLISLLKALKSEVPIKHVECRGLKYPNLEDLFALFEILSINNSVISLDISPHLINTQTCVFCFSPTNSPQLTAEQVSSLKCFFDSFNIKNLHLKDVVLLVKHLTVCMI